MTDARSEILVLWSALVFYVLGGSLAIFGVVFRRHFDRLVPLLLCLGLVLHTGSLALRWVRLGHGPFMSMFEVLSSNIWGLMIAFLVAYWRLVPIRPFAAIVMPLLFIMMGWLILTHPGDSTMPATFRTTWLFIHIGFAKVFLGSLLVAVGVSGVILARRTVLGSEKFARLPDDLRLNDLSFRLMALALVFHTLMLIAGAIWAQDAWGRYWAWDPLETWSFVTWLSVVISLHARLTFAITPRAGAWMVCAVFFVSFLTFFGVPFLSQTPHQGAV